MRDIGKIMSLVIVAAMVLTGFSALLPLAGADIINPEDDRDILISDTSLDNKHIFPGSQDVTFWITIWNRNGVADIMTDDQPISWANLSVSTQLRDVDGDTVTTPISDWNPNRVDDEWTISDGNSHTFNGFQFDVKGNAVPGTYNLTVTLEYETNIGDSKTFVGFIHFDIKNRIIVPDINNLVPGDLNVERNINVDFDNNIAGPIEDIELSITLPDTAFIWFGVAGSTITKSDDAPSDPWGIQLILSVSSSKDKGEYTGPYEVTYTINGVEYTETGEMTFTVGDLPMLEVSVGTDTLAQGTSKATWSLTFTNVGTVDLLDMKVQIDANTNGFTTSPADHWENEGTVTYNWLIIGDIDIGDSVTVDMEIGINIFIPEGVHKIMFKCDGMYYDPDTASYEDVTIDWVWDNNKDLYEPRVNFGTPFDADTSTVEGPYIMVTVTDSALDLMITSRNPLSLGGRLVDNPLTLDVQNFGNIDFINMIVKLETNTATSPFLNVIDPTAPFSEEAILGTLDADDTESVILRVNLKPGISAGVHSVPITIIGVNDDMGEAVETVLNARITITGVGPKLEVTAVAPGEIKNGADFTLTMTITNNGDDTARNVVLNMANIGGGGDDINGDLATPAADALPMYLADIAPGASIEVEVPMKANKDMSSGHVYIIGFTVNYIDSFGNGPDLWSGEADHYVSLKSTGLGGTVIGQFYYSLIILVLIAAICLIAYTAIHVKKYKKANPKNGVETQTEYTPQTSFPEETTEQTPPPPPME